MHYLKQRSFFLNLPSNNPSTVAKSSGKSWICHWQYKHGLLNLHLNFKLRACVANEVCVCVFMCAVVGPGFSRKRDEKFKEEAPTYYLAIFAKNYMKIDKEFGPLALVSPVADPRGGAPPTDQNFLNFMQFLGKSGKFVCWCPPGVGAPSYGESCIRPWLLVRFNMLFTLDKVKIKRISASVETGYVPALPWPPKILR